MLCKVDPSSEGRDSNPRLLGTEVLTGPVTCGLVAKQPPHRAAESHRAAEWV